MRNWRVPLGFLIFLLLSSCASQQDLVNLERQLQTTRGEVAVMRKGMADTRVAWEEQIRSSNQQQEESLSRVNGQLQAILSTIEAQQKAIASLNASVQGRLSSAEVRTEERLTKLEQGIKGKERGYLASQGNLGARLEELSAEVKIIQGKLEENNNLLAEQRIRFDDLSQQASRSGSKAETSATKLDAIEKAQSSHEKKLSGIDEQMKGLVRIKDWEEWTKQANTNLTSLSRQIAGFEGGLKKLEERFEKAVRGGNTSLKEPKTESRAESSPPQDAREARDPKEKVALTSPPGGEEIYKAALKDYNQENYELAIAGFHDYLAKYREGGLAANSQYWLGECYYSQEKYGQAIKEFEKVVRDYPDEKDKAGDAYLKMGFSYLKLGDKEKGKEIFMEVAKKYPLKAKRAQEELEKLK